MFERFTDHSRHVVVLSQEIARRCDSGRIDNVHILLALMENDNGMVLDDVLVDFEQAREELWKMAKMYEPGAGHLPFTNEAKKSLENALREALSLGLNHIPPECIFLGITRDPTDLVELIVSEGIDLQYWRGQLRDYFRGLVKDKQEQGPPMAFEEWVNLGVEWGFCKPPEMRLELTPPERPLDAS